VPAPVVSAGKTAQVQLPIDFGVTYAGEMVVKFEVPQNAELLVPDEIKTSTDAGFEVTLDFEIKAGRKTCEIPVRITLETPEGEPLGRPVTMLVTVNE
jgi:hypothetical protein